MTTVLISSHIWLFAFLFLRSILAERVYDELIFTVEKCQELGMQDDFDSCAVLEFCSSASRRKLDEVDDDVIDDDFIDDDFIDDNVIDDDFVDDDVLDDDDVSDFDDDDDSLYDRSYTVSTTTTITTSKEDEIFAQEVLHAEVLQYEEEEKEEAKDDKKEKNPVNEATYGYRLEGSTECSWPGPIMRLKRGEKHGLFLKGSDVAETNLHMHGLHVKASGGNGDWLHRSVQGTDNMLIYEVDLSDPNKHMGGTHWYHSHLHGSSWDQVKGGAFGMIVVDDNGYDVGTEDANVLDFLNDKEKILVLDDSGGNSMFYANGLTNEVFEMVANSWYRLRILLVGIDSHRSEIDVHFDENSCQVHTLANDGIFRFEVPKEEAQEVFTLSPSSRIDVAIKCVADSQILVNGKNVAAEIEVEVPTEEKSMATPFEGGTETWHSTRLAYTKDLRQIPESNVNEYKVRVDETNINRMSASSHKPLCDDSGNDFLYGSVQEWKLNGVATHPFHVHVYPMQVVSEGCSPHHEVGEFYDTIIAPDSSLSHPCLVRVHLIDIDGPTTIHCHLFEHAEHGAITWFNVENSESTDVDDGGLGPTCIGSCNEPVQPVSKCVDTKRRLRALLGK